MRIDLTPSEQAPYLLLRLNFDRSWASVGFAVSREDFLIVDQDRTGGILYVHHDTKDEDDKPGFIRRMLGAETVEKDIDVNYQVHVLRGDEGIEVRVFDAESAELERLEALRLLKKIRANLS